MLTREPISCAPPGSPHKRKFRGAPLASAAVGYRPCTISECLGDFIGIRTLDPVLTGALRKSGPVAVRPFASRAVRKPAGGGTFPSYPRCSPPHRQYSPGELRSCSERDAASELG